MEPASVFAAAGPVVDATTSAPATGIGAGSGIALTFGLLLINAFFVVAEFALVAARRSRVAQLAEKGNRSARALQVVLADLDRYIACTQVGITLASLGLGWVGEPVLAHELVKLLDFVPEWGRSVVAHALATGIALFALTTATVVLGEQFPKTIALRYPERSAIIVLRPLQATMWLLSPLVSMLNGLTGLLLRLARIPAASHHSITPDELRHVVEQAEKSGVFEEDEASVVRRALRFPSTLVRQVMVHRRDADLLDANLPPAELLREAAKLRHSRVPVYRGDRDRIVGVLHIKDLLRQRPEELDLAKILRVPLWVTVDTPIPDLVAALRRKRTRLALVTDEFGGFVGIVTLEDAAEVVLGEVLDEHDAPKAPLPQDEHGRFVVHGSTRVLELQEALDHEFQERAVTVGGLLMRHLGRLPEAHEKIPIDGVEFEVDSIAGTQVGRVWCTPAPKHDAGAPTQN
ncbi:MAG: HlyC/CorC family transporter [Planctomycetes bacterium]|nr:HlyC/CorC family transporter [Planctomycetota bacterium]